MNIRVRVSVFAIAIVSLLVLAAMPATAQVLKTVKDRNALNCGVSEGLYGFSARDKNGNWSGFDVDLCRAVAAAIFNDTGKVIDVLSRITTWTMSREVELGLIFPATSYFDGQGFLIRRDTNKETALDLDGAKICVQAGTTTLLNLADYFGASKMRYEAIT